MLRGLDHPAPVSRAVRMRKSLPLPALALFLIACLVGAAPSAAAPVAVVAMPPYTIEGSDDSWRGPAVDLFRAAADEAGYEYRLVPAGDLPAGAAPQVTLPVFAGQAAAAQDRRSLPFHVDAVGLVGGSETGGTAGFLQRLRGLLNVGFLKVVGIICGLLLVAGTIFWLVERSGNDDLGSDGSRLRGIGDGFWWAGVTATTIGYGDLVPRTPPGRVVAMVWMLFSMALTSILTAYIVSLTGARNSPATTSLSDAIADQRVGYIAEGPIGPDLLRGAGTTARFVSLPAALSALDAGRIDLVAHPYQAAKAAAGDRKVQATSGAAAMPVIETAGAEELRAALDTIILSPEWQQRMESEFGRN